MKRILSLGGATQDIFILYEGAETLHLHLQKKDLSFMLFEQGRKIEIPKIHYATGGGATNAGVGFKRLGLDTELLFKIGTDEAGSFIQRELIKEQVGLTHAVIDPYASTSISFIIPSREHNHVVFCFHGTHTALSPEDIALEELKNFDYIYANPLSGLSGKLLPIIAAKAKERGIPIATNPGIGQLTRDKDTFLTALPNIDVLILNTYEAGYLMQSLQDSGRLDPEQMTCDDAPLKLHDYFTAILRHGPSVAVVTNGAEGVYVATHEARYFHPSIKTKVISGLGAGDAFSAAFVGSIALGKTVEQAIILGVINASSVIHYTDAKEGLLTSKELERQATLVGTGNLQKLGIS